MKKIKLLESQIQTLLKLPETGMGYQKVKLIFKNGVVLNNMIVLNSEFLLVEEEQNPNIENIVKIEIEK